MNESPSSSPETETGRRSAWTWRRQEPKYKDNPYSEPDSVTAKMAADSLGAVKVSLFPGKIGIDFANHVDAVFREKIPNVERLVIDLRGNPGGGIGGLHLMSYLTPSKVPVGYSLDRPTAERGYDKASLPKLDRIPKSKLEIPLLALKFFGKKSVVLETSGLGSQSFHGRVVILVNEHTTGAAEMLVQFAQENGLGTVVGNKTPGRLVSRSAFKIGNDYRIVIPIGAYVSWNGNPDRRQGNHSGCAGGLVLRGSAPWARQSTEQSRPSRPGIELALRLVSIPVRLSNGTNGGRLSVNSLPAIVKFREFAIFGQLIRPRPRQVRVQVWPRWVP